ncbi:MAG TPA: nucleoside/nucleotide kinase family protein [Actinomycetales bacterium]|nr:nucleoside/nucleotide kinase family protein [Actinomycetales bacterium]
MQPTSFETLVDRARALSSSGRRLLGITGPPGAGKSLLASRLVEALRPHAALVAMDGFHLDDVVLAGLGRGDRKGAPDTFDVDGYVALLRRVRSAEDDVVYAPEFDRSLEASRAAAIPVAREVPLVITEGNYLLLDQPGWRDVRPLLDEVWYVCADEDVRLQRLVERHATYGKSHEDAIAWAHGSDQRNAELVSRTRHLADIEVRLPPRT